VQKVAPLTTNAANSHVGFKCIDSTIQRGFSWGSVRGGAARCVGSGRGGHKDKKRQTKRDISTNGSPTGTKKARFDIGAKSSTRPAPARSRVNYFSSRVFSPPPCAGETVLLLAAQQLTHIAAERGSSPTGRLDVCLPGLYPVPGPLADHRPLLIIAVDTHRHYYCCRRSRMIGTFFFFFRR